MSEVPLYRSTSLTRKRPPLGPYRGPMPSVLGGSWGRGHFLMGEVTLYMENRKSSRGFSPAHEALSVLHVQEFLAHKKTPTPYEPPKTLGIGPR